MKRSHPNENQNDGDNKDENDDISKQFESNEMNQHRRIVNDEYDDNSLQKKAQNDPEDNKVSNNLEGQDNIQGQEETDQKGLKSSGGFVEEEEQKNKQPDQQGINNSVQDLNDIRDNLENNTASQPQEADQNSITTEPPRNDNSYDKNLLDSLKLQYLNERNLKKLVDLCKNYPEIYKEFQKLKYKNRIYSINDLVLIQNADDTHSDFIGQLFKIMRIEYQTKFITLIQIKWYYTKSDLPKKFDNILDCISDNEIFETDHLDITFVDCINGPCRLYSYTEYDNLNTITSNTYFTRAKYDTVHKRLIPSFDNWEKGCICNRPLNPDYLYIQCEICEKWFHISCVRIPEKQVDKIDHFKCPNCVKALSDQQKGTVQPASQGQKK